MSLNVHIIFRVYEPGINSVFGIKKLLLLSRLIFWDLSWVLSFVIEDCICEGAELQYVLVRWTHYTGGCKDPPGVDEYSGLIKVYDTCVLEYFTIDFLLSGEATGRATYFYPRDECDTGMWLVDSICGTPECQ